MREAVRVPIPDDPGAIGLLPLPDAKDHLRVRHSEEDAYITGLIEDAFAQVESWTGMALVPQRWEIVLDSFPAQIVLPVGPVTSIIEIVYNDPLGIERQIDSAAYRADLASVEARLGARAGWPATAAWMNAVTIRWAAGKGCPAGLLRAVKVLVAHMYDVRDADASSEMVWLDVCRIMAPYRRFKG